MRRNQHLIQCTVPMGWLPVLLAVALVVGCQRLGPPRDAPMAFRVSGGSMAPTLLGDRMLVGCAECDLNWPVDATHTPLSEVICFHCGKAAVSDRKAIDLGELVQVEPLGDSATARGELVAIQRELNLHVKRIAAVPGDIVDLDGLQLTVNGRRLEDLLVGQQLPFELPTFLVDKDGHRDKSRWSSSSESWNRNDDRQWTFSSVDDAAWLIYSHYSVHDDNQLSPVWDDYSYNGGLTRKLHPVDRLIVSGISDRMGDIDVAMWTRLGAVIATARFEGRKFSASAIDGLPSQRLPVDANHPVAIRVSGDTGSLQDLTVERGIEYRLTRHHDHHPYPRRIAEKEYFVVGDNVPISVDSRDFGVVRKAQIVGKIMRHSSF